MSNFEVCPLCHAPKTNISFHTDKVFGNNTGVSRAFYHCGNCDVFFQWPRLTEEEERKFYKAEFEKFMSSRNSEGGMNWDSPELHIKTNEWQRMRREKYLTPHYEKMNSKSTLLEIGCSSGFMLYGLREKYGCDIYGIEPSGVFGDFLNKNKITFFESLEKLTNKMPEQKFDLITHFFVLEHIQDPAPFIKKTFELLKPGGSLVMEIPNADDPLRTLFPTAAFENFYWSIAHPWYFTAKSMDYLMKELCGLDADIKLDQRYDIGNHTKWMLQGKPGGQWSLDGVFDQKFNEEYKRSLISAGKCDTLVVVVTKR